MGGPGPSLSHIHTCIHTYTKNRAAAEAERELGKAGETGGLDTRNSLIPIARPKRKVGKEDVLGEGGGAGDRLGGQDFLFLSFHGDTYCMVYTLPSLGMYVCMYVVFHLCDDVCYDEICKF